MYLDYEIVQERLQKRFGQLHETAPGSIGDILHAQLIGETPDGGYLMTCDTYSWMQNPIGLLHGGIISSIFDQCMGMLAHCVIPEEVFAPSVQLNVSYIRPMKVEKSVLLKVFIDSATRTLIHIHAEAYHQDEPGRLCATASGMYYCKPGK